MKQKKILNLIKCGICSLSGVFILNLNAFAFTPTTEMNDLSPNHWAFRSIQVLVEKYHIMEGYPDKNFKGYRNLTRYEMAAVVYRIMTKLEEIVAQSNLNSKSISNLPNAEDLQTVLALQKEFKEELQKIDGKVEQINDRMNALDRVKLSGQVEVKYRDRISTSSSTSGPLGTGNPDKDGKISPARNLISSDDAYPLRARLHLNIDSDLLPELQFRSTFAIDEMAFSMSLPYNVKDQRAYVAGGHFGDEGMLGSPLFIERAYLKALPTWSDIKQPWGKVGVRAGIMNFKDITNTGTALKNHFSDEAWVGHGYGLLGWGGDELATSSDKTKPYTNSVSRFWIGDVNVSRVDPDSKSYNKVPAPAVSVETEWNSVKLMLGANFGSFYTSRTVASKGNLSGIGTLALGKDFPLAGGGTLMNSNVVVGNMDRQQRERSNVLDLPSEYGDGYYMFGLEFDLGKSVGNDYLPVRVAIHGMDYFNDASFALSGTRKEVSGVVDIGTNLLGATLQANSSFIGYDMLGMGVFANDIMGSDIDFGFGAKLAMRSILAFTPKAFAASNLGTYVVLPSFEGTMPRLLVGLRQSLGDTWGTETGYQLFKDSGVTLSLPFKNIMGANFDIKAEYSMLSDGALWSGGAVAHDLSICTSYRF